MASQYFLHRETLDRGHGCAYSFRPTVERRRSLPTDVSSSQATHNLAIGLEEKKNNRKIYFEC